MERKWWHDQVVYQIYPRSFMDSNSDGIGDLNGIKSKLWYLHRLGVQIIWLCPVYRSPNRDNGYDISDYYQIMEEFGTLEDMCALIEECKNYNISIIMDLVLNHSSDLHEWFQQSRSSRDNPYREYYIWKDPAEGKEPTSEKAFFGGSVWEWDEKTEQYYRHTFCKEQPDLNWNNSRLRRELYKMIGFWMDKGIKGFRLDAIDNIAKDERGCHDTASGKVHEFLRELNENTFGTAKHLVTVGETGSAGIKDAKLYSDPKRRELDMIFQFEVMGIDGTRTGTVEPKEYTLKDLKQVMSKWQAELDDVGWNSLFWSNHDYPRAVSRFGNDSPKYRTVSAKMLATLLHGMKGTPYIYQGEELGMTNIAFNGIYDYRDIETLNFYEKKKAEGWPKERIMEYIYRNSRDNARTPMQWDASEYAGFSDTAPWIRLNPNYTEINAAKNLADEHSVFYYYKKLIELRHTMDVLVYGTYQLEYEAHPQVFSYTRRYHDESVLVICNFCEASCSIPLSLSFEDKDVLISNYETRQKKNSILYLRPYEALMIQTGGKAR